ncbi:Uncharacterized protein FKW44_019850 [Caligus rogercresseyi]|uniref:Uncharacterized protein n=1 Tax=Caligus rogercresseyi TaxID=217165 RepID=A0A7T8GX16_CALRO|nr:Uncharacterized protein FKW44_019850 [Caligus rogercresseyi]
MTIGQVKTSDDLVKITAKIGNADHQEVEWLPDTGAECDVITADCLKKVGTKVKDLRKDKAELCGPDQGRLKSLGKVTATLRERNEVQDGASRAGKGHWTDTEQGRMYSARTHPTGWPHVVNKLSLSSPDEGNGVDMLLKSQSAASIREQLFQEFPEDKVKAHLETMVQKQIIERVPQGEAPEWLFSMVVVPKAGTDEPRVTVDFSPLNPFVKRPMYPCRVPAEEVAQIPPGMTHFTVLDGRHDTGKSCLTSPAARL